MKVRVAFTEAAQEFPYFPYSLIYTFQDDLITIHAVKHHSRDPDYWLDRVKARRR